jgi:putative transposase
LGSYALRSGTLSAHWGSALHYFSCYGREPYLSESSAKDTFEFCLEKMHRHYRFALAGYVVMPEHVHLLIGEPTEVELAVVLQALKISVSKRRPEKPFWHRRYYDFNVFSFGKQTEKIDYMHPNPIGRGLVENAAEWRWSSYQYYASGTSRTVKITPGYVTPP